MGYFSVLVMEIFLIQLSMNCYSSAFKRKEYLGKSMLGSKCIELSIEVFRNRTII